MFRTLRALRRSQVLSFRGLYYLVGSFSKEGTNLLMVLRYASKMYGDKTAIVSEDKHFTFQELYIASFAWASFYAHKQGLKPGNKVAFLCFNSAHFVIHLSALSALGVDVHIVNLAMHEGQIESFLSAGEFKLVIHAHFFKNMPTESHNRLNFLKVVPDQLSTASFKRAKNGKIVVMSGGTSGNFKQAARKSQPTQFIHPFNALLLDIGIMKKETVFISIPLFHGFGLSTIIVSLLLGKKSVLQSGSSIEKAIQLIKQEKVDVLVTVPTLIQRYLDADLCSLENVSMILSGGAKLHAHVTKRVAKEVGAVLYNLYGTSESGFAFIATPEDLNRFPDTIGRPVRGMKVKLDEQGCILLNGSWSMQGAGIWWNTKDVCYTNDAGYYFMKGRFDDMLVSGGENVFPGDVEQVVAGFECVQEVVALGIPDQEFGERLALFLQLKPGFKWNESELKEQLQAQLARFQQPKYIIEVAEIPFFPTGKVNRKKLLDQLNVQG